MIVPDNETDIDLLYYEAIAATVVELIVSAGEDPLTIGVHGDWGAGKSSILKMLEKSFSDEEETLCIRFNGWLFQGFEDTKAVLIETIIEELKAQRSLSGKAFERNRQYAARTRYVEAALGLHPQLVADRSAELSLFESLLPSTRYVGEIGLDASKAHYPSFERQQRIFERILELCANQGGKVISVHSVRCPRKVLDSIEKARVNQSCTIILHWFSGSKPDVQRALDLGCLFSVNERLLQGERGRKLVELASMESLLTETDAPFLEIDGCTVEAGEVENALTWIAKIRNTDAEVVRERIASNAAAILSDGS